MSNYVAVDLKVIEVLAPAVARSTGIDENRILAGLMRLWHRSWSVTSDRITAKELVGLFGPDQIEDLTEALCGDFLERCESDFRVRGADRYLRLKESRRLGAKKTNTLLAEKRAAQRAASERSITLSERTLKENSFDDDQKQASLLERVGANAQERSPTEHRTPNTKRSAPDPKTPAPSRDSDELLKIFREVTGSEYLWQGAKDGVALARLVKAAPLAEVLARWRRGLEAPETEWASCRNVAQLASKWNDLVPQPPKRVSIEDRPSRHL